MLKLYSTLFILFQIVVLNAQHSVYGGFSRLKSFGDAKPYVGFNLGIEIPKDNENSFYLRTAFYLKNKLNSDQAVAVQNLVNIDPTDYSIMSVSGDTYFNYFTIDGGNRYYLLDGYDNGFAVYGGTSIMGIINKASVKLQEYDQSKYKLPVGSSLSGTLLNLGVGLNGGAKYTVAGVGSFFLDANMNYLLASIPSNDLVRAVAPLFVKSNVLFTFNFGFRKDFY